MNSYKDHSVGGPGSLLHKETLSGERSLKQWGSVHMAGAVVSYETLNAEGILGTIKDLDQKGYQVWCNMADRSGHLLSQTLQDKFSSPNGIFVVRLDDPDSVDEAFQKLGHYSSKADKPDTQDNASMALIACRAGSPVLPDDYQRVATQELILTSVRTRTKTNGHYGLNGSNLPVPSGPPRREPLFAQIMRDTTGASTQSREPASLGWAPRDRVQHPSPAMDQPSAPALTPEPAAAPQMSQAAFDAKNSYMERMTQLQAKPETRMLGSVSRNSEFPTVGTQSTSKTARFFHLLSSISLGAVLVTFVLATTILSSPYGSPSDVFSVAIMLALIPLGAFFVFKILEARAHQSAENG